MAKQFWVLFAVFTSSYTILIKRLVSKSYQKTQHLVHNLTKAVDFWKSCLKCENSFF